VDEDDELFFDNEAGQYQRRCKASKANQRLQQKTYQQRAKRKANPISSRNKKKRRTVVLEPDQRIEEDGSDSDASHHTASLATVRAPNEGNSNFYNQVSNKEVAAVAALPSRFPEQYKDGRDKLREQQRDKQLTSGDGVSEGGDLLFCRRSGQVAPHQNTGNI